MIPSKKQDFSTMFLAQCEMYRSYTGFPFTNLTSNKDKFQPDGGGGCGGGIIIEG
ncbi:hypothetical protein Hanom_Chr05g00451461 [Helianthus anomalus]